MPTSAPRLMPAPQQRKAKHGGTYSVCCGVDVGKSSHHFAAIIPATGELAFDGKVEQSESGIRDALLSVSLFGSPIVVVDQPGNMAALLFAVCDDMGIAKGFIR